MYLSLKSSTAEKIGKVPNTVSYRILCDEAKQQLFVTITGNSDGGHFSNEIIPFANIEKCKEGIAIGAYVPSKMFFHAFVSRSTNNCGFLAAVLRAEELLAPVVDAVRKHVLQSGWDVWKELMLEETGEPYEPPLPKGYVPVVAEPQPKTKASKKVVVEVSNAESH